MFVRDLEWVEASVRGAVFSFVVVHQRHHRAFEAPYNVAVVELEEGCVCSPPSLGSLMKTSGGCRSRWGFRTLPRRYRCPGFSPRAAEKGSRSKAEGKPAVQR